MLFGRLFRLPSNQDEEGGPRKDILHHTIWSFLLCQHSLWVEERRCDLPKIIQNCLHEQIGRNVHAYVDDIVVKSQVSRDLISDLAETFTNLRKYNMKLNPTKCVFGVRAGKLLGFIVSERGIEANPDKIKAVMDIQKPEKIKDVQ